MVKWIITLVFETKVPGSSPGGCTNLRPGCDNSWVNHLKSPLSCGPGSFLWWYCCNSSIIPCEGISAGANPVYHPNFARPSGEYLLTLRPCSDNPWVCWWTAANHGWSYHVGNCQFCTDRQLDTAGGHHFVCLKKYSIYNMFVEHKKGIGCMFCIAYQRWVEIFSQWLGCQKCIQEQTIIYWRCWCQRKHSAPPRGQTLVRIQYVVTQFNR